MTLTKAPAEAGSAAVQPLDGGSYEVIRQRLEGQAKDLAAKAAALNERRKSIFGGTELRLLGSERVRTDNACVPRDIASVAGHLLFGFHVELGLKSETRVEDVFALYTLTGEGETFELAAVPPATVPGLLTDEEFQKAFRDVYKYIREARLLQLRKTETRLLVFVQAGAGARDVKVFRFAIDAKGGLSYLDSRGEEDAARPRGHAFAWTQATRDNHVAGPHPHVSILDEVFVETVGGDLTVKVENNTKTGRGIYAEPVDDPNQTLDDADIAYAKLGELVLLRVRPYREKAHRFLVFNGRTQSVVRIDALEQACLALPEDQGILFPGGYLLVTGEHKSFPEASQGFVYERTVRSPNGEDALYVFHRDEDGLYALLAYNVIRKEVSAPVLCHGYSLFDDGKMVVFRAQGEPSRVHPLQIWQTPFVSVEHAAVAKTDGSYLAKVGNADLVRGISEAFSLVRLAQEKEPTRASYEALRKAVSRFADAFFWAGHEEAAGLLDAVREVGKTASLIEVELEKALAIKKRAAEALDAAEQGQKALLAELAPEGLASLEALLSALARLRAQRGHLETLKEVRAIDVARLTALDAAVAARFDEVSRACAAFLLKDEALGPIKQRLEALVQKVEASKTTTEITPLGEELSSLHEGATLLAEVTSGLTVVDAASRTAILERTSEVLAQLNRARALFDVRRKDLRTQEARAEFSVQFRLFGQAVTSGLALCDSPERCDAELTRLLVQLEELEGKFGGLDEFAPMLADKRVEVGDALGARRQALTEERQKRAEQLYAAADRILTGVRRRATAITEESELHAYLAADPLVRKLGELATDLEAQGAPVKAEEVRSRLLAVRQDALRVLRDKADMFEEGAAVLRLGRFRFAVHTQPLELALLAREGGLAVHLTGTDFYAPLEGAALDAYRDLWDRSLPSESNDVFRAEYLAAQMLFDAEAGVGGRSLTGLLQASVDPQALATTVRAYAAERYDEGYERGVHDADATLILERFLSLRQGAGLLRFGPDARALGALTFATAPPDPLAVLQLRARSLAALETSLGPSSAMQRLADESHRYIAACAERHGIGADDLELRSAARYLVLELAADKPRFVTSAGALTLRDRFYAELEESSQRRAFEDDLRALEGHPRERFALALAWVSAFAERKAGVLVPYARETSVLLLTPGLPREPSAAVTKITVTGLFGQHPRIVDRKADVDVTDLEGRLRRFAAVDVPRFREFRKARAAVLDAERARLRLDELKPKVLTSFVRNRLIDEVYLPLIGANLAKQIGAVGEGKRTDTMGLLLLVSPPGYGKTTLMEYVATRLGLVFMKVNGPALGHEVTSLDPAEAPNATARQEVERINLALEMGNNVMLYLDDIQHTNPELLQKFISLCDAQRKIEGVFRGRTRTYDLRGKRFCVCMAGNPYTESGERFRIPDMLANRADTYNLGEILDGKEELFAQSYLENALTSHPLLAPLTTREPADVPKLFAWARGESVPLTELAHGYAAAEAEELVALLRRCFQVQKTLLAVNRTYILSASQEDAYRVEPPFKLQGSYRNMNKVTEKLAPAMTEAEVERVLDDHYASEAQTLTTGAEQNLLKLAELRGRMTEAQGKRWAEIKESFARVKRMGGREDDPVTRVVGTLGGLDVQLQSIRTELARGIAAAQKPAPAPDFSGLRDTLLAALAPSPALEAMPVLAQVVERQASVLEQALNGLRATPPPVGVDGVAPELLERLDELSRLIAALDERLARGGSGQRLEVSLGWGSGSNFYRGLSGNDVVEHGGLFVATYGRPPRVGAPIALRIVFPTGEMIDTDGVVAFVRAHSADVPEDSAGFGVRLRGFPESARPLVEAYVAQRPPAFHA